MKHYYKSCKNTKQINSFIRLVDKDGFILGVNRDFFDPDYGFPEEFDFDSWLNPEQTIGCSIQVHTDYEVHIDIYTKKDIEKLESEIA